MALDPILARRKAIDDAAKKRALELSKPFEYQKPKSFKDARYQDKFNKDVYGFQDSIIAEAKSKYGPNWRAMLKDQGTELGGKLIQGMANYEAIVNNTDQITDLVATIDKGLEDNSMFLSPEKRKVYNEYKGMLNDFGDYDKLSKSDFESLNAILIGERDLNDYINKSGVLSQIEPYINQYSTETDKGTTYVTKEGKTTDYNGIKKQLAKELKETTFANSSFSEQDIYDNLDARLKNQTENKSFITEKTQSKIDAESGTNVPMISSDGAFVEYTDTPEKKGVVKLRNWNDTKPIQFRSWADYNMKIKGNKDNIYVRDEKGKISPTKFDSYTLSDIQIVDDEGKSKSLTGNVKVQLEEMTLLDDGRIVQKAKVARPKTIRTNGKGEVDPEGNNRIETFEVTDELIILQDEKGQGTSAASNIKVNLNKTDKNSVKNYDDALNKMEEVRNKKRGETKPSMDNNVEQLKGKEDLRTKYNY
jgi:hypothetical protein